MTCRLAARGMVTLWPPRAGHSSESLYRALFQRHRKPNFRVDLNVANLILIQKVMEWYAGDISLRHQSPDFSPDAVFQRWPYITCNHRRLKAWVMAVTSASGGCPQPPHEGSMETTSASARWGRFNHPFAVCFKIRSLKAISKLCHSAARSRDVTVEMLPRPRSSVRKWVGTSWPRWDRWSPIRTPVWSIWTPVRTTRYEFSYAPWRPVVGLPERAIGIGSPLAPRCRVAHLRGLKESSNDLVISSAAESRSCMLVGDAATNAARNPCIELWNETESFHVIINDRIRQI